MWALLSRLGFCGFMLLLFSALFAHFKVVCSRKLAVLAGMTCGGVFSLAGLLPHLGRNVLFLEYQVALMLLILSDRAVPGQTWAFLIEELNLSWVL